MAFSNAEIAQIVEEFFKIVGTRQYIGARYVPIFGRKGETSIEWDNTKPYEPLTIVLYEGNSYTSRQTVPIGVDISDEYFWANTGNYNAQIEAYRQSVNNLSEQFDLSLQTFTDSVDELEDTFIETITAMGSSKNTLDISYIGSIRNYDSYIDAGGCVYLGDNKILTTVTQNDNLNTGYRIIDISNPTGATIIDSGVLQNAGHANSLSLSSQQTFVIADGQNIRTYSNETMNLLTTTLITGLQYGGTPNGLCYDESSEKWYCLETYDQSGTNLKCLALYEIDIDSGICGTKLASNIVPYPIAKIGGLRNDCFVKNGVVYWATTMKGSGGSYVVAYDIENEKNIVYCVPKSFNIYDNVEIEGLTEHNGIIYFTCKVNTQSNLIAVLYAAKLDPNANLIIVSPNVDGSLNNARLAQTQNNLIYESGNSGTPFRGLYEAIKFCNMYLCPNCTFLENYVMTNNELQPFQKFTGTLSNHTLSYSGSGSLECFVQNIYLSGGTLDMNLTQSRNVTIQMNNIDFSNKTFKYGRGVAIISNVSNITLSNNGVASLLFQNV